MPFERPRRSTPSAWERFGRRRQIVGFGAADKWTGLDLRDDLLDQGDLTMFDGSEPLGVGGGVARAPILLPQVRQLVRLTGVVALAVRPEPDGAKFHDQRAVLFPDPLDEGCQ